MKVFVPFSLVADLCKETNESLFYFGPFEYDYISDEQIKESIKSGRAKSVNLSEDWNLNKSDEPTDLHSKRTGALVLLIDSGVELPPVDMEMSEYNRNTNFVTDGHHRIRAYRYLKHLGFWAELSGYERMMKQFASLCRKTKIR